jgi:hypothetical protein
MRTRRPGISLFAVLFPAVVFAGFIELLRHSNHPTVAANHGERLLDAAQARIDAHDSQLKDDPLHAVKDIEGFAVDSAGKVYVARAPAAARLRLRYLNRGKRVLFADRANPTEPWDSIEVIAAFLDGGNERRAVASYRMTVSSALAGAIVSTAGDVKFAPSSRTRVFGPTRSGGENPLPEARFDCDRMEAAARAGGGMAFADLASFASACNLANASGRSLEGIIVVHIDPTRDGARPTLSTTGRGRHSHRIQQGIHVRGTLLFRFAGNPPHANRLVIDTPLSVNAADLSNWRPEDETTYPTGYPPTFADKSRAPWNHSIAPEFVDFAPRDGLPAVIVDKGSLTIRGATNACGVIFATCRIRIANTRGETQFVHGSVLARDGVVIANGPSGRIAIRFDPKSLIDLQTSDDATKALTRIGFAVHDSHR